MKMIKQLVMAVIASLTVVACSSTPQVTDASSGSVFNASLDQTRQAVEQAIQSKGFKITKNEPGYIQGKRPHKMGLVVGSGGETIGITLKSVDDKKTEVKVDTARSFVGIVGQQSWDSEVMSEITQILEETS